MTVNRMANRTQTANNNSFIINTTLEIRTGEVHSVIMEKKTYTIQRTVEQNLQMNNATVTLIVHPRQEKSTTIGRCDCYETMMLQLIMLKWLVLSACTVQTSKFSSNIYLQVYSYIPHGTLKMLPSANAPPNQINQISSILVALCIASGNVI